MNLLEETLETLAEHGKKPEDVIWVGSHCGKYVISWEKFAEIADFEYDESFGCAKIATDLVVVGNTWWLERHEYDGSEWWEFKTMPALALNSSPFTKVGGDEYLWPDMVELNGEKK